jgi:serine phosphatase RsbU (regulator of sigma subunit)/Tfp pilus assembly protein PilF
MKPLVIFILAGLLLVSSQNFSQNYRKIDSLKIALSSTNELEAQLDILDHIFWQFLYYNNDSALYYAQSALALSAQSEHSKHANAILDLAICHRVMGNTQFAKVNFQKAIEQARDDNNKKALANCLFNYGQFLNDISALDSMISTNKTAHLLFVETGNNEFAAKALISQGTGYYYKGNADSAKLMFREALDFSKKHNNNAGIAQSIALLGFMYEDEGDYHKSFELLEEALDMYIELNDSFNIATCYNDIGILYDNLGNSQRALEYYQMALELNVRIGDTELANNYMNIGGILSSIGELSKAEEYYLKAFDNAVQNKSSRTLAGVVSNLVTYYTSVNKEKAIKYLAVQDSIANELKEPELLAQVYFKSAGLFERDSSFSKVNELYLLAYEHFKKSSNHAFIPIFKNEWAEYLLNEGKYEAALVVLIPAIEKLRESEEKGALSKGLLLLSKIYEIQGKPQKSLIAFKEHSALKDSLLNESNIKEVTQLEMQFGFDQKLREKTQKEAKQKALYKAKIKQQTTITIAAGIAVLLSFVVLLVVIRSNRIRKKANLVLQEKNKQINEQNEEISAQRDTLHKQNEEITSSIKYAQRIQQALLPTTEQLCSALSDFFVLFLPRDIVSGDYYWTKSYNQYTIIVAADCTGHGVPGAFMSMLGVSFLNEITATQKEYTASEILNNLRTKVKSTLKQETVGGQKDGMDIALCVLDNDTKQMQFSGAFNPLYLVRNGEVQVIKADKQPVAVYATETEFTNHCIELQANDKCYIFSDGFADQFGGEKSRKYMSKRFRNFLLSNAHLCMEEQKHNLLNEFYSWKGANEQVDDVLVIGFAV